MATNLDFDPSEFDRQRTPLPKKIEFSGDPDAVEFIATINDLHNERTISPTIALKRLVLRELLSHCLDGRKMLTLDDAVRFSKDVISVVPMTEKTTVNELLIPIRHPWIQASSPHIEMDFSPIRAINMAGGITSAIVSYLQKRRSASFEIMCAEIQAARYGNASTRLSDELLEVCYSLFNESPDVSDTEIKKASDEHTKMLFSGVRTGLFMAVFKIGISLFGLYLSIKLVSAWLSK